MARSAVGAARSAAVLLGGVCAVALWPAMAQAEAQAQAETSPPPAANAGEAASRSAAADTAQQTQLEEVLVTARKRVERLQAAPVGVTAISGEELLARNQRDITEVALFTPGFSAQNIQSSTEQLFIRGQSTTSFLASLQTASTLQDGVYSATLGRTVFFPDVQRIEVIKGPQAALFGRATFAGAVNYILKKPTDDFHVEALLRGGSLDRNDYHLAASGPIVPGKLSFRISANSENSKSDYENHPDGAATGVIHHYGVQGQLRWTPTSFLEFNLRVQNTNFQDHGQVPLYLQGTAYLNCQPNAAGLNNFFCGTIKPRPELVSLNFDQVQDGFIRVDQTRAVLESKLSLPGGYTLTSTTGYAMQYNRTFCDCDYSNQQPFAAGLQSLFRGKEQDTDEEVRLTSPVTDRVHWILGVYGYDDHSTTGRVNTPTPPILPFVTIRNRAVFGSLGIDLPWRFVFDFDARYQVEKQKRTAIPGNPALATRYDAFLPRYILSYKPNPTLNVYVSASKGDQPGQFNTGANIPAALVQVGEEELWSYEAGAKARLFNGRLEFNLAGFQIDWDNQAYSTTSIGSDGRPINILANLGGSRIRGVELEGEVLILPGWTARGTFSYTDARYRDFISANARTVLGGTGQVAGAQLPNTPPYEGSISSMYTRALPWFAGVDWYVRGDYAYRGEQYVSEINLAKISAAHLVSLHTGVRRGPWRFDVDVDNVLDDDSPIYATRFADTNSPGLSRQGFLIEPRNGRSATATLRYDF